MSSQRGSRPTTASMHSILRRSRAIWIVQTLISVEGVDINALNRAGETAFTIAEKLGNEELADILREVSGVTAKEQVNPPNSTKQLKQTVSDIRHDVQYQDLKRLITNKESREANTAGGEQEEDEAGKIREEEVVMEADEEADVHRVRPPDFPGGTEAFELAAKFCNGVKLGLTPTTAERLGMSDNNSDDNLISRANRFLSHTVPRNPRDTIRALKSCEGLLPLADDLGLVSRCVDTVAAKATVSAPTALFGWPITC